MSVRPGLARAAVLASPTTLALAAALALTTTLACPTPATALASPPPAGAQSASPAAQAASPAAQSASPAAQTASRTAPPASPSIAVAPPRLPLSHAGRWIIDAAGRVVILHGVNMVYKVPPYYPAAAGFGADDAAFLARIGFNAVRVGVLWEALEPQPGVYDDGYLSHIAQTVAMLARHGIVSLLDFHQDMYNERFQGEGEPTWSIEDDGLPPEPREGFPNNYLVMPALQHAYDHFWANSPGPGGVGLGDRYAAAWRHVALRFRSERSVLGYELFNEPFPGSDWQTCVNPAGCPTFDPVLTAFNRLIAAAIRTVDPHTLIWYEPNVLFDFGAGTEVGGLDAGPAGFSFHDYCFQSGAGGGTSGCQATYGLVISHALSHIAATGEALLMSEFGDSDYSLMSDVVALDDQHMVPWLEWSYCPCDDPTGAAGRNRILTDPAKPPRGANVNTAALAVLVEPYPQLVAGTPLSWGFARSTRTFTLRYSTARADGRGRFRPGSETAIAVPAFVYGGRYEVVARGAAVVSSRGAGVLRVVSCPRARTITVTVRPLPRRGAGPHRRRIRDARGGSRWSRSSCRPPAR